MVRVVIDNREVEVEAGSTILDAASKLGIEIPTMCFLKGYRPSTSCMVCVVEVVGLNKLVPACGSIAEEGMRVITSSEEVARARRMALELLLSDHLGDCMGPCQVICPAKMEIPLMIRQIAAGRLEEAIATIKKDIALPAVLGRICPAPCERGCRRGSFDKAVSICKLKRYAADVDLQSPKAYLPVCKNAIGKEAAIVGAGPTGLAAGYYLLQEGIGCTIFDEHEKAGGMLQYGVPEDKMPRDVLEAEIKIIEKLGAKFKFKTKVGKDVNAAELQKDFDAILLATGKITASEIDKPGFEIAGNGIVIDKRTYQTNLGGVFASGDMGSKQRLAVRAVADGRQAAISIRQFLSGEEVTGSARPFNTHIGKLGEGQTECMVKYIDETVRQVTSQESDGFTDSQAKLETARCMHCDCRKAESCKLREYAEKYKAKANKYGIEQRLFVQHDEHPDIIYEPGKCIDCGLCVQIASAVGEKPGLTFIGRGFNVRMEVPFGESITEGLKKTAGQCVTACPTGALAFKDNKNQ
ncbi:MAG: 2Fe-2S iron-sulfur cluster-binding protein [Planctomycetota bacterium]|jgi:NADPH-dependent glutamate synthase beta subunit-like oxidoreductase